MTTPTDLPQVQPWAPTRIRANTQPRQKHAPLTSVTASARLLTGKTLRNNGKSVKATQWQEDAWDMYDLVGEQRFLVNTLASRIAQAKLFVGRLDPERTTEDPIEVEDEEISHLIEAIGGGPAGRSQIIHRLAANLLVSGDGWLVGIPKDKVPESVDARLPDDDDIPASGLNDLRNLSWFMLSISEIEKQGMEEVRIKLGEDASQQITTDPDEIYLIRVWRPHPRRAWESDSPTRASLPVLRELVGLTMHISAQVDSRLAGAGVLIAPQSAQRAMRVAAGMDEDDESDPFTAALIEAMMTPISDRASASAVVPLVVTVPDEVTDKFNHISFSTPLDTEARNLRDEAIRRLALGQDAPPELLLGTDSMNHWGAWLVREDVVNTHLEPTLALISDALTTQYLWPMLIENGMDPAQAREHVVWYDVSDLIVRPNRAEDAMDLHGRGVLSDEALLRETGFTGKDAPEITEETQDEQPAHVRLAIDLIRGAPTLLSNPGLPSIAAQIKKVLEQESTEEDIEPLGEEEPASSESAPAAPQSDEQPAAGLSPTDSPTVPRMRRSGSPEMGG